MQDFHPNGAEKTVTAMGSGGEQHKATEQTPLNGGNWEKPDCCGGWLPEPVACILVMLYLALNLILNYYNAFLLGASNGHIHLPIPIFYTLMHQVTIVLFTSLWCLFVPSIRFPVWETFRDNWSKLIFVSITYAASIATNNCSFASISLTVNTIFKSAVPFPTMVFSYFIEGKSYSMTIVCIVAVLVAGTLLAVPYGAHQVESKDSAEWVGYMLVIFSMVATAIRPVISSVLMNGNNSGGVKLSGISMAFFDALIAIALLLPVALVTDFIVNPGFYDTFINNEYGLRNAGYVALGCVMAGVYGPVTFYTIKMTSSLTFIILGNFKQLFLLTGAALFVDHVTKPLLWIGVAVTAGASLVYSYQTNKERNEKAAADAARKAAEEKLIKPSA